MTRKLKIFIEQELSLIKSINEHLQRDIKALEKERELQENAIEAMENALLYKEKVIDKYKQLLETAVEHL